jgi:hypothetical protein
VSYNTSIAASVPRDPCGAWRRPCQDAGVTVVVSGLVSVAATALLAFAAVAGGPVLAAAIALLVVGVAVGWSRLGMMPDSLGTTVAVVFTGLVGTVIALVSADRQRPLLPFAALIAFAVLLAFAHELRRRDGRPKLVESVTGTIAGQLVAVLAAGWLLLRQTPLGSNGVVVAAAAVVMTRLVSVVCERIEALSLLTIGWVAFGVGLAAAVAASFVLEPGRLLPSLVMGAAVAAVVAAADLLIAFEGRAVGTVALITAALAPVAAAGTTAYAAAALMP